MTYEKLAPRAATRHTYIEAANKWLTTGQGRSSRAEWRLGRAGPEQLRQAQRPACFSSRASTKAGIFPPHTSTKADIFPSHTNTKAGIFPSHASKKAGVFRLTPSAKAGVYFSRPAQRLAFLLSRVNISLGGVKGSY